MSPYAWLAALLVVIATATGLYWKGHVDGFHARDVIAVNDENRRKVAEDKAIADRLRANELRAKKEAADKAKIVKGYENELAQARATHAAAVGLRVDASVCRGFAGSGESKSASDRNADTPATIALPESIGRNLQDLARQADEVIATCRALQEWVKSQDLAP